MNLSLWVLHRRELFCLCQSPLTSLVWVRIFMISLLATHIIWKLLVKHSTVLAQIWVITSWTHSGLGVLFGCCDSAYSCVCLASVNFFNQGRKTNLPVPYLFILGNTMCLLLEIVYMNSCARTLFSIHSLFIYVTPAPHFYFCFGCVFKSEKRL